MNFVKVFPAQKIRIVDTLEKRLTHYNTALLRRMELVNNVIVMKAQNAELKNLLNLYLVEDLNTLPRQNPIATVVLVEIYSCRITSFIYRESSAATIGPSILKTRKPATQLPDHRRRRILVVHVVNQRLQSSILPTLPHFSRANVRGRDRGQQLDRRRLIGSFDFAMAGQNLQVSVNSHRLCAADVLGPKHPDQQQLRVASSAANSQRHKNLPIVYLLFLGLMHYLRFTAPLMQFHDHIPRDMAISLEIRPCFYPLVSDR